MLQTLKRLLKVRCYSCRLRLVLSVQLARVTNMGADTKTPNLRLQRLSISYPEKDNYFRATTDSGSTSK